MNKQAGYIAQAHLLLAGIAIGGLLFSTIPFSQTTEESNAIVQEQNPVILPAGISAGKTLFLNKCGSCHTVFEEMTGPALGGFQNRGPWADREKLYQWIRNPLAFMENDSYTSQLKDKYRSIMTAFPNLRNDEIDLIAEYIKYMYQSRIKRLSVPGM